MVRLLELCSDPHDMLHKEHRGKHLTIISLNQEKYGGAFQPEGAVLGQYTQRGLNERYMSEWIFLRSSVFNFYGWVTKCHKCSGLKSHTLIMSRFLWVGSPANLAGACPLRTIRGCREGVGSLCYTHAFATTKFLITAELRFLISDDCQPGATLSS